MPRHTLAPISRAFQPTRDKAGTGRNADGMDWDKLDRVQVLGTGTVHTGHTGCVNALSWSEDGGILLSGSDDKRLCIWTPDSSPIPGTAAASSPHPMKLSTSIATGHHANIFSAKFLPNAGTPTIVSVAGDREIRLMEVERLAEDGRTSDLRGHNGPGVRVLKCHRDRTKKIATENSPFLFMTVSEDGTVRQHDLRRPHQCPGDCPTPLFRAPLGVDLYSLSVSNVAPHIFAVAGRTDTAFVCDRRMVERQSPSWGSKIVGSGQVHCVRRLGLTNDEWDSVNPEGPARRMYAGERHITCVKMSPEHADEAAVSFARHSTSLFSIYDSPGTSSAHKSGATLLPSARRTRSTFTAQDPTAAPAENQAQPIVIRSPPTLGKRRQSDLSSVNPEGLPHSRARVAEEEERPLATSPVDQSVSRTTNGDRAQDPENENPWPDHEEDAERVGVGDDPTEGMEADFVGPMQPAEPVMGETSARSGTTSLGPPPRPPSRLAGMVDQQGEQHQVPNNDPPSAPAQPSQPQGPPGQILIDNPNIMDDLQDTPLADLLVADDEDAETYENMLFGEPDDPLASDIDEEEDEWMEEDELDDDDFDEDEDDDDGPLYPDRLSEETEFGVVDMITPRRMFKGAKNVETVKDCNFLGTRADKICSGSDDGNFFVWDKDTGRLEGIWEGDGSVVNVMEQHPSLPVVAVSGIDDTVKMFAPTATPPNPSFSRLHLAETIIRTNTDRRRMHMGSTFNRVGLLQFLAAQGVNVRPPGQGGDEEREGDLQGCQTQ